MKTRLAAAVAVVSLALAATAGARERASLTIYAAASLTEVVPEARSRAELQLRRLEHPRDADQERRAC